MPIEWSYDVLTYLILFMCTRVTSFQQTKVSVQPHPSAVNMTLLTFAAECRHLLHGAIDWYLPTQHSAANPPHVTAAFDRWGRQTDGRTLNRFVDSARHTMWQCHNQIKIQIPSNTSSWPWLCAHDRTSLDKPHIHNETPNKHHFPGQVANLEMHQV